MKPMLLMIAVVALVGCGKEESTKASTNELFVEAVQLIESAEGKTGKTAIKEYEQGLANLRAIMYDIYSESDLRDKLISGETLITGRSLKEIKGRVAELKLAEILIKANLEKATELSLEFKRLTKIPQELEKLDQLKSLDLERNKLTDLTGLEKLTQLEFLGIGGNPDLTKAQIDQLQKALPKCRFSISLGPGQQGRAFPPASR